MSAHVIKHFKDLNQPVFTLAEASILLRHSSQDTEKKLMRDMVNRGLVLRLKDGVYWIIPYEQDAANYFPNADLAAGYLLRDANYYVGYYSAGTARYYYTALDGGVDCGGQASEAVFAPHQQ